MIAAAAGMPFERIVSSATRAFIHLMYAAFMVAGILSAVISSIAEFEVIKVFFPRHGALSVAAFALLVVFVLEVAKLFLTFFNRAFSASGDESYAAVRWIFNATRYALVIISVAAMQLYAFYSLHNPGYDEQVTAAQAAIRVGRDERVRQVDSSYASRKREQFALDAADVTLWETQMRFEMNNIVGRTWEGAYFRSHKQRFEEARQRQAGNQMRLETERLAVLARVDSVAAQELATTKERLKTDPASQNRILSATLQLLNGSPIYSYEQYAVSVIIISLLLSITLEGTIWVVFTALAVTYGSAFTSSLQIGPLIARYTAAGRTENHLHEVDAKTFRDRIVHEKRTILETLRGLLHPRR